MVLSTILLCLGVVGVIDSGIDPEQSLFKNNIKTALNLVDTYASIKDYDDHGTPVAGIIARLSPKSQLLPIAVCNEHGVANYSSIYEAIEYCIEHQCFIINMSLNFCRDKFIYLEKNIESKTFNNCFFVVAAGNDASYIPPKTHVFDNVIFVAALKKDGSALASYSNYGDGIDIAAISGDVGEGILTCSAYRSESRLFNGTSGAAAVVSGYLSFLKEEYPLASLAEIKQKLFDKCYQNNDIKVLNGKCLSQENYIVLSDKDER